MLKVFIEWEYVLILTPDGKKRCCRNVRAAFEQRELSEGQGRLEPQWISAHHLQLDDPLDPTVPPITRSDKPLAKPCPAENASSSTRVAAGGCRPSPAASVAGQRVEQRAVCAALCLSPLMWPSAPPAQALDRVPAASAQSMVASRPAFTLHQALLRRSRLALIKGTLVLQASSTTSERGLPMQMSR